MKFKTILISFLFVFFIFVSLYEYFFLIVPLKMENQDLKKENEVLILKLSKEIENLGLFSKDTSNFKMPEPLLKAKEEISKEFNVKSIGNKIKVTILTDDIFLPGNYIISNEGKKKLLKFANLLKEMPYKEIEVRVHTDDIPVQTKKDLFPTNWELSARRGTEIVRFLIKNGKIPEERIYVSAFGASRPLYTEKTKEARKKNRRAEFIIKF